MRGLVALICVCWASSAVADRAGDLFEEGKALRDQGKWAEACAKFAESYAASRKPGTQLNLGECAERDKQNRRAWLLYDDAAREYDRNRADADTKLAANPGDDDAKRESARAAAGAKLARQRAAALAPKLATVIVRLAEPRIDGLTVRIGDRAVPPSAAITELLDAGNVTVTASAPGRETFTTTTDAEAGKQVVIEIPGLAIASSGGDGGPLGKRKKSRVMLALGLGAGGGVLLVVSGIVGLGARSDLRAAEDLCEMETGIPTGVPLMCGPMGAAAVNDAGGKMDVATYVGVAGAVALAAGAIVYFTAPREGLAVTPTASASGAGVSISGRF